MTTPNSQCALNSLAIDNPIAVSYTHLLSNVFKKICLGENEDIANAIEVYMQHKFLDLKSLEKYHVAVMELIGELYHLSLIHI